MKKILISVGLILGALFLTGCDAINNMENITIYTSSYPIEFVTKELYGEHAKVYNMYPQGIDLNDYKLTDKQVSDYATSDLIIYNGLSDEQKYIVKMINKNNKLKIIDATSKIEYSSSIDEIWINPSNLLKIAKNTKDGLDEYINSNLVKDEINTNYENLKVEISSIDADLKEMVENAADKTIVTSSNKLNFLTKYGLNVISVDESTLTDKTLSDAKKALQSDSIGYLFIIKGEENSKTVEDLLNEVSGIQTLEIDTLANITTEDKNDGKDYISIMNENIDKFKQELY
ncbi:MAG: zinc ABC transporter substrate-binding protein [Bacilli bacterium]|nr:zinc ABC transporter substrate-binding protein [Bacilli bacterium]